MMRLYAAWADELNNEELFLKLLNEVDRERAQKVNRIRHQGSKKLSLAAGILLKKALGDAGIFRYSIEKKENDKPYIEGRNDIFFNLSHSGSMVICAVSDSEVGCDIEIIKDGKTKVAERFFTPEEQRFAAESDQHFYRMWTLKESFMKVTGKGLSLPMRDYSICVGEGISVRQNVDERQYYFKEYFDFTGYACSVCLTEPVEEDKIINVKLEDCLSERIKSDL